MAKKAVKKTGVASAKPTAKKSKNKPDETPKPSVASGSKTGPALPTMPSSSEIERMLAVAHKSIAMGGFAINSMLSRRKLNLKLVEEAAAAVSVANDTMKLLLTTLRGP